MSRDKWSRNIEAWADPAQNVDIVNPRARFNTRQRGKMLEAYIENHPYGLTVAEQANEYGVDPSSLRRMLRKEAVARGVDLPSYCRCKDDF